MFESWIGRVRDEFIEDTRALLRIRSVKEATQNPDQPFGEGPARALAHMLSLAERHGMRTKNVDGYAGHIEIGEGQEYVAVLAHLDVVPEGSGWTHDPYGADIVDGKIIARGAVDDKGPAMTAFYALRALAENGVKLGRRVRLILGLDEESGWQCMDHYFKVESQPVCGFTPDADFPIIHAEKGIMDFTLTFSHKQVSASYSVTRISGGQRPNMVPDYAEAVVECTDLASLQKLQQAAEGRQHIQVDVQQNVATISATGRSAHGSTPHLGENAVQAVFNFLVEVGAAEPSSAIAYLASIETTGLQLGIACKDDVTGALTANLGVFEGDAQSLKATFNIRYPVDQQYQSLLERVREATARLGGAVELADHKGPLHVAKDDPLIRKLASVYTAVTGEKAELLTIGGGTYARAIDKGVAFGPVFPGGPEVAHQKDEYVDIEDLVLCIEIYAQALAALAND